MSSEFIIYTLSTTAVIAAATTLLGIGVAKTMHKSNKFLSFFIAIGAGLLVGVALTEFLPQVFAHNHSNHEHNDLEQFLPALLILLGIFFVIVLEKKVAQFLHLREEQDKSSSQATTHHHGHSHDHSHDHEHTHEHEFCVHSHSHAHDKHISLETACLSIGCVTVCSFFDGLEISTAFYLSSQAGWLTSLGFLLHSVSNGALAASLGIAGGFTTSRAAQVSAVIGGLLFLGSLVGVIGISLLDFKTYVLPFSTGVMLYISFTHLIPLALKDKLGWAGFVLGTAIAFFSHSLHVH